MESPCRAGPRPASRGGGAQCACASSAALQDDPGSDAVGRAGARSGRWVCSASCVPFSCGTSTLTTSTHADPRRPPLGCWGHSPLTMTRKGLGGPRPTPTGEDTSEAQLTPQGPPWGQAGWPLTDFARDPTTACPLPHLGPRHAYLSLPEPGLNKSLVHIHTHTHTLFPFQLSQQNKSTSIDHMTLPPEIERIRLFLLEFCPGAGEKLFSSPPPPYPGLPIGICPWRPACLAPDCGLRHSSTERRPGHGAPATDICQLNS